MLNLCHSYPPAMTTLPTHLQWFEKGLACLLCPVKMGLKNWLSCLNKIYLCGQGIVLKQLYAWSHQMRAKAVKGPWLWFVSLCRLQCQVILVFWQTICCSHSEHIEGRLVLIQALYALWLGEQRTHLGNDSSHGPDTVQCCGYSHICGSHCWPARWVRWTEQVLLVPQNHMC